MRAGRAASARVSGRTPLAPLPASSPKRLGGINGRTSAEARDVSLRSVQFSVAKSVQFSVAIDSKGGRSYLGRSAPCPEVPD